MAEILTQISLLIVLAGILAIIGRFINQPPTVAYLAAGFILGRIGLKFLENTAALDIIAEIGIILLLHIAGLNIDIEEFLEVKNYTLIVGGGYTLFLATSGFLIGTFLMGLSSIQSAYLGLALSFSSTVIVGKTLGERKEIAAPHGRILIGTMILQDIIAMIGLALFSSIASGGNIITQTIITFTKAIALFIILYFLGKYVISWIFDKVAEFELILVMGLAWIFSSVIIAEMIGFSAEIAAFIAGMAISDFSFSFEIKNESRALQDFALMFLFFVTGARVTITDQLFGPMFWILTALVLVGAPLVISFLGSLLGMEKRSNFLTSLIPAQTSEFSIIIVTIGLSLDQVTTQIFSTIVAITVITMTISSIILSNINTIYHKIEETLELLEWKREEHIHTNEDLKNHILILGFSGLGRYVAQYYENEKEVVIVEWKKDLIELAEEKGYEVIYGDAGDPHVWREANLKHADLVINTIGDNLEDDIRLQKWIKEEHSSTISIAEAAKPDEVPVLESLGYDHVIDKDKIEWAHIKDLLEKEEIQQRMKEQ